MILLPHANLLHNSKSIAFIFLCRSHMLKYIFIASLIIQHTYQSHYFASKIHSEFRPRPIQTIPSPADSLSLHSLLNASSTVLYSLTSMLQAGPSTPVLFWGVGLVFFSPYSTADFQALSRVLILHFWFTKPSPKVKSFRQIRR